MHPLQSFSKALGPEQLDGAWGAVTAETQKPGRSGRSLAETLGLRPFELADDARAAYHAGASMASNYLVTLRAAAGSLLEAASAPARGARPAHPRRSRQRLRADRTDRARRLGNGRAPSRIIREERPELEELYLVLAAATARIAGRDSAEVPA